MKEIKLYTKSANGRRKDKVVKLTIAGEWPSHCVVEKPIIPPAETAETTEKNILSILVNSIRKFKKFLK